MHSFIGVNLKPVALINLFMFMFVFNGLGSRKSKSLIEQGIIFPVLIFSRSFIIDAISCLLKASDDAILYSQVNFFFREISIALTKSLIYVALNICSVAHFISFPSFNSFNHEVKIVLSSFSSPKILLSLTMRNSFPLSRRKSSMIFLYVP